MSMTIKGDTFTTFDDLWKESNLSRAEKKALQLKIETLGKRIKAKVIKGISQKTLKKCPD
jgi:hypothetical protein